MANLTEAKTLSTNEYETLKAREVKEVMEGVLEEAKNKGIKDPLAIASDIRNKLKNGLLKNAEIIFGARINSGSEEEKPGAEIVYFRNGIKYIISTETETGIVKEPLRIESANTGSGYKRDLISEKKSQPFIESKIRHIVKILLIKNKGKSETEMRKIIMDVLENGILKDAGEIMSVSLNLDNNPPLVEIIYLGKEEIGGSETRAVLVKGLRRTQETDAGGVLEAAEQLAA